MVGGSSSLSKKFITHHQGIDFAMSGSSLDTKGEREALIQLVERQIDDAQRLVELMRDDGTWCGGSEARLCPLRGSARRSKTVLSSPDRRRIRMHASRLNRRLDDRRSAGSAVVCRARTSRIFLCKRRVACCNRVGSGVRSDAVVRGSLGKCPTDT